MISVGTSSGASKRRDRLGDPLGVVGVADPRHVPAIGEKARRDIVAEGEIRVTFDRDAVAVVNPAQVAEHQMTGERGGLARDALHHVAVAADRINVVVEHREVGPIEMLRQPALGDRHADARRRSPGPAARSSSRRPRSGDIRDGRGICCRAGGNCLMSSSVTAGSPGRSYSASTAFTPARCSIA